MSLFTGVVLLGVVLAALTIGIWWKKTNVVEMLAFGVIYWLCAWVVTAMGFFVLDVFSLLPCAVGTVVLELAVGAAALIVRKKRDKTPWRELMTVSWDIRPYWLPILVCAGGFVLVAMKHELFGMGQDEGVYQTVAINFLNGVTDRQQDFPEYHTLSEAQQETFRNSVYSYLVGYDIGSRAYPDTVYDLSVSPVSGIYHGIPTYASLLAMWGKLFGMAQMQDVQTVFYGCTILDLMEGAAAALYSMLPAVIFVVACVLAFASGTSWGTFGILIPIVTAIFPASSELLIIGISACCAGSVMGDHCSPISDTSIMASAGAQCNHLEHVSTQLPYVLTVACVCVVGFVVAGFVQNVYITWIISLVLMLGTLFVIRALTRRA